MSSADRDHQYLHESGRLFYTGCERPKYAGRFAAYSASQPTYSLADIFAKITAGYGSLFGLVWTILDQGEKPWCWDYSATQCMMLAIRALFGEKVLLDTSCGPIVTGVRGGNSIDAMLQEVQLVTGQPSAGFVGSDPTQAVTVRRLPSGWQMNAALRKAIKWLALSTPEDLASALINGHPCVFGINWQGGGHALCVAEVSALNGALIFAGPNSWSLAFDCGWGSYPGRPGWYQLTAAQCSDAFGQFGCYALVGVTDAAADEPVEV